MTFLVTGSLHVLSFPRARPTTLLLLDTIRRSAQSSSSGLPQRKRTYLVNRTCGIGSIDRLRTCSRTQDSGRFHLKASSLLSMNSYLFGESTALVAVSRHLMVELFMSAPIFPHSSFSGNE